MKKVLIMLVSAVMMVSCCGESTKVENETKTMEKSYKKTYTNADFYVDGVFQPKVAEKAFREMFDYYGYEVTPFLEANWWFIDFGLGDFENCGMGGVFYVNDPVNGYFAHDIYLLPGQMIPEHSHVATKYPAKMESWKVQKGWAYNFSEVGDPVEGWEAIVPASQKATTKSKAYVKQNLGEMIHLSDKGVGTWHFLVGGDQGVIVQEYANYHDGEGLRFTNPNAKM